MIQDLMFQSMIKLTSMMSLLAEGGFSALLAEGGFSGFGDNVARFVESIVKNEFAVALGHVMLWGGIIAGAFAYVYGKINQQSRIPSMWWFIGSAIIGALLVYDFTKLVDGVVWLKDLVLGLVGGGDV